MAIIDLPAALGDARYNENFWLFGDSAGAGPGLDGREQVLFSENRVWHGQIDLAPLFGDDILRARSVGTRLRGRVNLLRLPFYNLGTVTFDGNLEVFYSALGYTPSEIAAGYSSFSDGTIFDDGSGFALPDTSEPTLKFDVAANATTLTVEGFIGENACQGARFSINDFLYEVEENAQGTIRFSPPMRTAAAAGQTVNFSRPSILVRLKEDRSWKTFTEYGLYNSTMTVQVIEAFERD